MIVIPWESNAAGDSAALKAKKTVRKTPAKLKFEAIVRMTDISLVSAKFENEPKVFEPKFWVILDSGCSMEFIGLYSPAFPSDKNDGLPTVCIRIGKWEKVSQSVLFAKGLEPRKFDVIHTIFFGGNIGDKLVRECQKFEEYMANGLTMVDSLSKENKWESIRVFLNTDVVNLEFEYSPIVKRESYIEDSFKRLKNYLDQINFDDGIVPDKSSHRVSYKERVADQISG